MKTLYDKLGVTRDASSTDIDLSYRHSLNEHLAGNGHRPRRQKDQLRLQQVRQAYLVLASPSRRLEYDLKLDRQEHARLRRIERLGAVIGLLLLLAGLALIARGYYQQVYDGKAVPQGPAAASAPQDHTVLAAERQSAAFASGGRTD